MSTVLRRTAQTTIMACFTISASFTATQCFAETISQNAIPVPLSKSQTLTPAQVPTLQAQISPTQLNSIFTPPPRPQQSSTAGNYRITPVQERGDRPQLRDIMRLEPAPLPSFVYKNVSSG